MPARFSSAFARRWILTETFKQKKQELVREGFDPQLVKDPLFFQGRRDPVPIARSMQTAMRGLLDGSIRL